jgi:hypothetical protein
MLQPTPVGLELMARDEPGADAARHGPQLALPNQSADVLFAAAKLDGKVSNCQPVRFLQAGSIAPRGFDEQIPQRRFTPAQPRRRDRSAKRSKRG